MNKLSCLEHLSTLSFSTEMSEMMLRRWDTNDQLHALTPAAAGLRLVYRRNDSRDFGQLGSVVVPVDEAEEDLEHQQSNLGVVRQREGEQRLQERAGESCEHVGGLKTCRHLRDGKKIYCLV